MAKLIHAMFRVLDLERSIDFYAKAFALKESHRLDFSGFTLVYLRNSICVTKRATQKLSSHATKA